jgi:hypothetical protein
MATERQIAANRKNALRSKGPSSRAGIARAARNAYRHGLAATPGAIVLRQVEELAKEITGPSAGYVQHAMACEAAHAAIDLARVRQAKVAIFNRAVVAERGEVSDPIAKAKSPATADAAALMARALRRALPDLFKLDRYEARALARRNRAMRAFMRVIGYPEKECD